MPNPQHDDRSSRTEVGAITSLFVITLIVFWLSPVTQVSDSHYSLLLSDSLLRHRSFRLDHYALPRYEPQAGVRDDYVANGPIWQLEIAKNNHLYYYFPPGSSVLSVPFIAVGRVFGISVMKPDGTYNEQAEIKLQKALAALLMALCVCVIFITARYVLPVGWSFIIALSAAFGTQIWSTTSRALWSHTWETLLVSVAVLLLVRNEVRVKPLPPVLLGSIAAWLYFIRPSASLVVVAIAIYLFLRRRRQLVPYLLTGLVWLALFVLYSWREFGTVLPSYYKPTRLRLDVFTIAFAGNLISPSRGLLVYVPILLFVLVLLLRFWSELKMNALVWLAIFVVSAHLLLVASFANRWGDWWGGASFGPRYLAELVPWFTLLAMFGIAAMLRRDSPRRSAIGSGATLLAISIFINARGALSESTWKWTQPSTDEQMRAQLWDWWHPQFLAGMQRPALPASVPVIEPPVRIDFANAAVEKFLWYGWSVAEPGFRWTDGREAGIVFRLNAVRDTNMRMRVAAFTVDGKLDQQQVIVTLNGQTVQRTQLNAGPARELEFRLPTASLKQNNVLTFQFPNAASPQSLGLSEDKRLLGVRVEWLEFQ